MFTSGHTYILRSQTKIFCMSLVHLPNINKHIGTQQKRGEIFSVVVASLLYATFWNNKKIKLKVGKIILATEAVVSEGGLFIGDLLPDFNHSCWFIASPIPSR